MRVRSLMVAMVVAVASLGAWLVPDAAEGALLKRVHSGTVQSTFASNQAIVALDLPDASKAFVICHVRGAVTTPANRATCLLSNNQLTVRRAGTNAAVTVSWYVAEFAAGVTVQRNSAVTNIASGTGSTTAALSPSVDCNTSFSIVMSQTNNTTVGNEERFTVRGYLQDQATVGAVCPAGQTTNVLRFDRNETGTAVEVAWQVVTVDRASVQRGLSTIAAAGTSVSPALSTCIETAKSFILQNHFVATGANSAIERQAARAAFSGADCNGSGWKNNVTFTRATSGTTSALDLAWEVVTFDDGTAVLHGSATGTGTHSVVEPTAISARNLGSTLPMYSVSAAVAGANTRNLVDYTAEFTTETQLRFTRGTSSSVASTINYQVVTFNRCLNDPLCTVGATAGTGVVTVQATPYYDHRTLSSTVGCPRWGCAVTVLRRTGAQVTDTPSGQLAVGATVGSSTVVYAGSQTTTSAVTQNTSSITVGSTTGFPSSCTNGPPLCRAYIYDFTTGASDEFTYTGVTATTFTGIPTGTASGQPLRVEAHAANSIVRAFTASEGNTTIPIVLTNAAITSASTSISTSTSPITAGFAPSGTAHLAGGNSFQYTSLTASSFEGVTGINANYVSGASVVQSLSGFANSGLAIDGTTYFYKVFPKTGPAQYVTSMTASQSQVAAVPAGGATLAWTFTSTGGSALNSPSAGSDRVYFSTNGNKLVALNQSDGTISFITDTYGTVSGYPSWYTETGGGEAVAWGDDLGWVYSIDNETGRLKWTRKVPLTEGGVSAGITVQARGGSDATFQAAHAGDLLFVSSYGTSLFFEENKVFALNGDDGSIAWTFDPLNSGAPTGMDSVIAQPAADWARNRLYITTRNGSVGGLQSLWKLNTVTGALVDSLAAGNNEFPIMLTYDASMIYFGTVDEQSVKAFDITSDLWNETWAGGTSVTPGTPKSLLWEDWTNLDENGSPPAGERRLFITTDEGSGNSVRCLQDIGSGGTSCWTRAHPNGGTFAATIIGDDALYVGSGDGKVYALDYATGAINHCFPLTGSPTVGDSTIFEHLFVGSSSGTVYKLNLPLSGGCS